MSMALYTRESETRLREKVHVHYVEQGFSNQRTAACRKWWRRGLDVLSIRASPLPSSLTNKCSSSRDCG